SSARTMAAIPRRHDRPRCCRWARTGPHRWEREPTNCGDKRAWELLHWHERPVGGWEGKRPADYTFCPCGHTVACHLTAEELADLEARSAADERRRSRLRVVRP